MAPKVTCSIKYYFYIDILTTFLQIIYIIPPPVILESNKSLFKCTEKNFLIKRI